MNTIKVKTIKSDEFAGMYYQGEYGVDLSKTYAEVPPAFADHLVGAGLAEYLKKDEIKRAAPPENAPVFVARAARRAADSDRGNYARRHREHGRGIQRNQRRQRNKRRQRR